MVGTAGGGAYARRMPGSAPSGEGAATITWSPGRVVPVSTIGSGPPVVLAHGAGAGPDHPFLAGVATRMARAGFSVTTFAYPYVAEGRKAPDRFDRLVAAHTAVIEHVAARGVAPFLVGKSMGGRIGSHLDLATPGRVFFGYPLVPPGRSEPRDTSHLRGPMLFIQGERDRLAPIELVRGVVGLLPEAELIVVPEADHSFAVPKRVGVEPGEMLDRITAAAVGWMQARSR